MSFLFLICFIGAPHDGSASLLLVGFVEPSISLTGERVPLDLEGAFGISVAVSRPHVPNATHREEQRLVVILNKNDPEAKITLEPSFKKGFDYALPADTVAFLWPNNRDWPNQQILLSARDAYKRSFSDGSVWLASVQQR